MNAARIGWYTRSEWIKAFRPDGKGHIRIIADAAGPIEDIEFDDIICDTCNADAGPDHEDGTEGRIYFDGTDSLCEPCGAKAEARYLEDFRQGLLRRGWAEFHVRNLSPENLRAIAHEWNVDEIIGVSPADVAKSLRWDCVEAILWASRLLEEVNEHRLSKLLFDAVEHKGGDAQEADR